MSKPHTPAQITALHIVHRGLADVRLWLGEITHDEHAAAVYVPRHAAPPCDAQEHVIEVAA